MLLITAEQFEEMNSCHFLRKIRDFLSKKTSSNEYKAVLENEQEYTKIWAEIWASHRDFPEIKLAVTFSFMIACIVDKLDPVSEINNYEELENPEYEMRSYCFRKGFIRLCEI